MKPIAMPWETREVGTVGKLGSYLLFSRSLLNDGTFYAGVIYFQFRGEIHAHAINSSREIRQSYKHFVKDATEEEVKAFIDSKLIELGYKLLGDKHNLLAGK